jgi:hypothetical protein
MAGVNKEALMMSDDSESTLIDLSTVYFYEKTPPATIELRECSLPIKRDNDCKVFLALHGYQSKQDGFMAASKYAAKQGLDYTIIDFQVKLEQKQKALNMKPEELAAYDFVSLVRASKDLRSELQEILLEQLSAKRINTLNLDITRPDLILKERPELIACVMDEPGWEHLKVTVFQAQLPFSEFPINVAAIPYRHWDAIQEAHCRLNPTVQITLDPPISANKKAVRRKTK